MKTKNNRIPRIALGLSLTPILWLTWYIQHTPVIRVITFLSLPIFLFSFFGLFLQIIGLILAVVALIKMFRGNNSDKVSVAFSIFAILAPFIWGFVLFISVMDYILSYQ